MQIDNISKKLTRAMQTPKEKTSAYDTRGVVARIEEDIAWVRLTGSSVETPVRMTIAASKGDVVQVRVSGGTAWLTGNGSAPPTDDTTANKSYKVATQAGIDAAVARDDAAKAYNYASQAEAEAARATAAAVIADAKAVAATTAAAEADAKAVAAGQSADAAAAQASAAQTSANTANTYANAALDQLGIVEDVVGVLDLLQKNGNYQVTQDTTVQGGKWYFTRSGAGTSADPYVYAVVQNPSGNPNTQGWYELTGIDQSIQNYVTSQLAVTDEGLWLQRPAYTGIQTKVLLSATEGVVLYGINGQVVGKYGQTAQVGDESGFHIKMDGEELGFYQAGTKVAYINNNQLYITQSVVLQQMDLGIPVIKGGLGQWSWKVHANSQNPSRNNLNLKWVG